jgi:hypothetical protein
LTDTELSELKAELPDKWEYYIDRLSGYIASLPPVILPIFV